eukprot:Rmarinus@m.14425
MELLPLHWSQLHYRGDIVPPPRWGHTCTPLNEHELVIFGGIGSKKYNCLYIFDRDALTWGIPRVTGDSRPHLYHHSATLVGRRIYFFSGRCDGKHTKMVHILDLVDFKWTSFKPPKPRPAPRSLHCTVLMPDGQTILLFGGYGGHGKYFNDIYLFDTETNEWKDPGRIGGTVPPPRCGFASCLSEDGNTLYVMGGNKGEKASQTYEDMYSLDLRHLVWTKLPSLPHPMTGHLATICGSLLYVVGGKARGMKTLEFDPSLYTFDLNTMVWSCLPPSAGEPLGRVGQTLCGLRHELLVYGGSGLRGPTGRMHVADLSVAAELEASMYKRDTVEEIPPPPPAAPQSHLQHETHHIPYMRGPSLLERMHRGDAHRRPERSRSGMSGQASGAISQSSGSHHMRSRSNISIDHGYLYNQPAFVNQTQPNFLPAEVGLFPGTSPAVSSEGLFGSQLPSRMSSVSSWQSSPAISPFMLGDKGLSAANVANLQNINVPYNQATQQWVQLNRLPSPTLAGALPSRTPSPTALQAHAMTISGSPAVFEPSPYRTTPRMSRQLSNPERIRRWGPVVVSRFNSGSINEPSLAYHPSQKETEVFRLRKDNLDGEDTSSTRHDELDVHMENSHSSGPSSGEGSPRAIESVVSTENPGVSPSPSVYSVGETYPPVRDTCYDAFDVLLKAAAQRPGWRWSYVEIWTINSTPSMLEFRHSHYVLSDMPSILNIVNRYGHLIDGDLFMGGDVETNYRQVFFASLNSVPRETYIRTGLARKAGLRSCETLPLYTTTNHLLGFLALFSDVEAYDGPSDGIILDSLMEVCGHTADMVFAYEQLEGGQLANYVYAQVVAEKIDAAVNDMLVQIFLRVAWVSRMLAPIFRWACAMDSESHKAAIDLLVLICSKAQILDNEWAILFSDLQRALRFLACVSPVDSAKTPVRGKAQAALRMLEDARVIQVKPPPYFGPNAPSPAIDALKEFKDNLVKEFAESELRDDVLAKFQSLSKNTPKTFSSFDIWTVCGQKGSNGRPYNTAPIVTKANEYLSRVAKGDNIFTNEAIQALHAVLPLEPSLTPGAFRDTLVVGSYLFFQYYRVFVPWEEVPTALGVAQSCMASEGADWCPLMKAFFVFSSIVHYVHPFLDGNGKLSRLLGNIFMRAAGYPDLLFRAQDKVITLEELMKRMLK